MTASPLTANQWQEPDEGEASTSSSAPAVSQFVRGKPATYTPPSIRETGTLRPAAEWYPAWMRYRRREDNYVFWKDKFERCSMEIPPIEKRWTLFSTVWWLVMELRFFGIPPAIRYLMYRGYRAVMTRAYEAHKALVLWQCKFDAYLASRASGGAVATFSKTMALRRLHWQNCLVGELLYAINTHKTGRVHLLPPRRQPWQRPTFFWFF